MTNATKPHTFKVGDRAIYKSPNTRREIECTIKENVEGWWLVEWGTQTCDIIRPSELTPADPVPDAATLLVRELCAAEWEANGDWLFPERCRNGAQDRQPAETAFAKYIRANQLTVERVREAFGAIEIGLSSFELAALHAALTERKV